MESVPRRWSHPLALAAGGLALLACVAGLARHVPIGANYWDLGMQADAVWRIAHGQLPSIDFFAAAGPLTFLLHAAAAAALPEAHPLLIGQYASGALAIAALAVGLGPWARRDPATPALLMGGLVLLVALPFNISSLTTLPGVDGYGLYNRQAGFFVYAVAALALAPSGVLRAAVLGSLLAALFLLKINGFVGAIAIVALTALGGRLTLREAGVVVAAAAALLAAVELATGLVGATARDMLALAGQNEGGAAGRVLGLLSVRADVSVAAVALIGLLALRDLGRLREAAAGGIAGLFGLPSAQFAGTFLAVTAFDSQNTGSQEYAALWPMALTMLAGLWRESVADRLTAWRLVAGALAAAMILPPLAVLMSKTARAVIAAPFYETLPAEDVAVLGPYGRVLVKPDALASARILGAHYASAAPVYAELATRGVLPALQFYSATDYQALMLTQHAEAYRAIRAVEAARGAPFASVALLDFVDPLPRMLGIPPARGLTIGLELSRGVPASRLASLAAAYGAVEALVVLGCPDTAGRLAIREGLAPALLGRERIEASPCISLLVRRPAPSP
jgi:hypothetical protein